MSEQEIQAAAPEAPPAPPSSKRWYIVHAYSGMEKAVERNLRERIDRAGMQDKFGRILVPTEEVVELKNGKKSVSERRFFPGYVFAFVVVMALFMWVTDKTLEWALYDLILGWRR